MIIRDTQLGSVNYSTPKLLVVEVTPNPTARAVSTNEVMIVGQFTRGSTTKLHRVGSLSEVAKKLGGYREGLDGYTYLKDFFDANGGVALVARVATSGGAIAEVTIDDGDVTPADVFDITFESFGTCGNSTYVDIFANPTTTPSAKYFNMVIRNSETGEQKTYNKVTTDSTDSRYIKTLIDNDVNRFFNITMTLTDGTLPAVGTYQLSGGTNGTDEGSTVLDTVYVGTEVSGTRTGIQLGKSQNAQNVSIVVSARNSSTINTALVTHVEDMRLSPRRTIITLPSSTVAQAITARQAIDSDKVKFVFPNVKIENINTSELEEHNVTAIASAIDSTLSYHQSASQANLGNKVKDLAVDISPSEVDELTSNQINPIVLKRGGYIFASDYTCSQNTSLQQNVVRKAKDFFAKTFYEVLQPFLSKPISQDLWNGMKEALEGFCRIEASAKRIGRSDGSIPYAFKVDNENNPTEIVQQNKVIIEGEISLLAPADIIMLYLDARQDKVITNA